MAWTPKKVMIAGTVAYVIVSVFVVLGAVDPMNTIVYEWLQPLPNRIFSYVTELGSAQVIVGLSILGLLFWLWRGNRVEAWRLALVGIGTLLLTQVLKLIYGIDRPLIDASLDATTYSFPSGHASGSFALYGLMAYVLYKKGQSKIAITILVCLVVAVSLSRVILNVHYFSDVLGGWFVALTMIALSEWFIRRKTV
ncbi:phosphatase PAP2 family protein [Exiguobacterium marinum]|uniref:Phosphatase PAP2 family protein n=1 Tax=Exiguobacterium marinum TaxID=273528 RepID=A0ABY7X1W6_9BACL|nr:phosphatase PAP2 family protein [Exiguobacterium marinum]WDH76850.1 phosphatase PAP2 family protein [Exiguobacterium marinum]